MNAATDRQPTCAERVAAAAESRLEDLRAMLDPCAEDIGIERDGNEWNIFVAERTVTNDNGADLPIDLDEYLEALDTDAGWTEGSDWPEMQTNPDDWDDNQRKAIMELIFDDHADSIREAGREAFSEYGLAFDYVEPGTFTDQDEGYWRYQISWGGPSEEIRFYADRNGHVHRAEFWYLDWFDGAPAIVTDDERALAVWSEFNDSETVQHVFNQAMEG